MIAAACAGILLLAPPSAELLDRLGREAARADLAALRLTCIERVLEARGSGESERRYAWALFRTDDGAIEASRYDARGPDPSFGGIHWPDSHEWLRIFAERNRGFFLFEDQGKEGDLRAIGFRGALPFRDGGDVREWEGRFLVDLRTGMPVDLRATPVSQTAKTRNRWDRYTKKTNWGISLFGFPIVGGKMARHPRALQATVRFQISPEASTLPAEVRYEDDLVTSRTGVRPERVQTRIYEDCRRTETSAESSR